MYWTSRIPLTIGSEVHRVVCFALLAGAVLLQLGCDEGGGGGPMAPTDKVFFAAARTAGPNAIALRRGAATQGTRLQLELVANDVRDLHTVSFILDYPSNVLRFTGQGQGPFLQQGNTPAILIATPLPAPFGSVLLIDTRPDGVAGVSGSGVILTLEFEALASGSGPIVLEGAEATDSQDREITLDWIGGTATAAL